MATYDLGDGVNIRYYARDRDGNLTDATVTLVITKPDGTTTGLVNQRTSLGTYDANTYVPTVVGTYGYTWNVTGAITDVSYGSFTVLNPGPAGYADLTLVKSQLGKITVDDRDEMIQAAIIAASRMIDTECGLWPGAFRADSVVSVRTFNLSDRIRQIRPPSYGVTGYYAPYAVARSAISVDAISTATGLIVASGTYASGVYTALVTAPATGPEGAPNLGEPIQYLMLPSSGLNGIDSIQVTARWGWPVVPPQIEMAARLLAARLYRRKDSPQGVITSADWGAVRVSRTDPDVHALLYSFMTPGFA